jgi:hypothetical protein
MSLTQLIGTLHYICKIGDWTRTSHLFTHSNEEKQKIEWERLYNFMSPICLQKRLHDWKGAYDGVGVGIVGVWMFIRGVLKGKQEILIH